MGRLGRDDVLVVTRLDQLARSTRDLLDLLGAIADKGAGFKSMRDTWADHGSARQVDADGPGRTR
jgi:DNA invertase Pin-like site-specific DNA recombinase